MKSRATSGFTLVEIMIALAILSVSLLSLYTAQGNSLRASGHAEQLHKATQLARTLMTEKMFALDKDFEKGLFPEEKVEERGEFEKPYEGFRWEFEIKPIEIPVAAEAEPEPQGESKTGQVLDNQDNVQVSETIQKSMGQIVSKKINESVRVAQVKVIWDEVGEEQSVQITTHLSKLW